MYTYGKKWEGRFDVGGGGGWVRHEGEKNSVGRWCGNNIVIRDYNKCALFIWSIG